MLDFKPHRHLRGWRGGKDKGRKSVVYGFRKRRNLIDHFEGRRVSMKWGLDLWDEDYTGCWRSAREPIYDTILCFLAAHLGQTYEDTVRDWCKGIKPWKNKYTQGGVSMINYYLGLQGKKYWQRKFEDVGWTGFGLNEEGRIIHKATLSYNPFLRVRPKKWSKWLVGWNKEHLHLPNGKVNKNVILPIGEAYVMDLEEGRTLIPEPRPVFLAYNSRWDSTGKYKCWGKDKKYLRKFKRVVPCGCSNEWIDPLTEKKSFWYSGAGYGKDIFYFLIKR